MEPSSQTVKPEPAQMTDESRGVMIKRRAHARLRRQTSSGMPLAGASSVQGTSDHHGQGQGVPSELDRAVKLLSETAHDIKSPLSGIREVMRLVRDGDMGRVSLLQREVLDDAIGQCDLIASIAENMLQVDRLRNGLPNVVRKWIMPSDIIDGMTGLVQSLATPRRVQVVWKGFDHAGVHLFADQNLLRRILLNLIGNAVTVSEEQALVEVSLTQSVRHGMCRISVADHGPGMAEKEVTHLARRGTSGTGSSGLGLQICNSLAALHFTRLALRSQLGQGTRISLEIPSGGPTSIALAFARWREIVAPSRGTFNTRSSVASGKRTGGRTASGNDDQGRTRLARGAYKSEVLLPFDGLPPRMPTKVQSVGLRAAIGVSSEVLEEIDRGLQGEQRMHELVYRTDARRWIVMWDCGEEEVRHRCHEVATRLRQACDAVQFEWLMPQQIPVGHHSNRALIHDILVRDTLHANARSPMFEDREVFTDILPEGLSEKAAVRLEQEIKRLGSRMRGQSRRLKRQADRLVKMTDGASE